MKRLVQAAIRGAHVRLLSRDLPPRLGLYFHDLAERDLLAMEEALRYLHGEGYRACWPEEIADSGSDRRVFLSCDDNYRSWYLALPTLERLAVPITFYINTEPLRDRSPAEAVSTYYRRLRYEGEPMPLDSAEIRALADAGHRIGAHAHTHRVLSRLPPAEAEEDIRVSKLILEDILGAPVTDFAYPYGMRRHFGPELRAYCRAIGFRTIANAIPGLQHQIQASDSINRTPWRSDRSLGYNLDNLRCDGRWWERATGRSAVI